MIKNRKRNTRRRNRRTMRTRRTMRIRRTRKTRRTKKTRRTQRRTRTRNTKKRKLRGGEDHGPEYFDDSGYTEDQILEDQMLEGTESQIDDPLYIFLQSVDMLDRYTDLKELFIHDNFEFDIRILEHIREKLKKFFVIKEFKSYGVEIGINRDELNNKEITELMKLIIEKEIFRYRLFQILRSGKVYKLNQLRLVEERNKHYLYDGNVRIEISLENVIYNNSQSTLWKLKCLNYSDESLTTDLAVIMKGIVKYDLSEKFYSKVFRNVPEFNEEYSETPTGEFSNCGIMQIKELDNDYFKLLHKYYDQLMILETGYSGNISDLSQWIIDSKKLELRDYVILATRILWQIISQLACLQKYGVFSFDIKAKNILIIHNIHTNKYDIRAILIDMGGFGCHVPTLLSALKKLENYEDEIEPSIKEGLSINPNIGKTSSINFYTFEKKEWLNIKYKKSETEFFICSLFPLFPFDKDKRIHPYLEIAGIDKGYMFNAFAIGLLTNELVCRKYWGHEYMCNFKGIYWRAYSSKINKPDPFLRRFYKREKEKQEIEEEEKKIDTLRLGSLQKLALKKGIDEDKTIEAMDEDNPEEALIKLIMEKSTTSEKKLLEGKVKEFVGEEEKIFGEKGQGGEMYSAISEIMDTFFKNWEYYMGKISAITHPTVKIDEHYLENIARQMLKKNDYLLFYELLD